MHSLAILLGLFAVIEFGQGDCGCDTNPSYDYSILKAGLRRRERSELRRIICEEKHRSRSEVRNRLEEWAKKYNKTANLEEFYRRYNESTIKIEENINDILEQIPLFIEKLTAISANMSLSKAQMNKEIKLLKQSVNASIAEAACCVVSAAKESSTESVIIVHDIDPPFFPSFPFPSLNPFRGFDLPFFRSFWSDGDLDDRESEEYFEG